MYQPRVNCAPVRPHHAESQAFASRRSELNLSVAEAANRLGIDAAELMALEHGDRDCDWTEAHQLLEG